MKDTGLEIRPVVISSSGEIMSNDREGKGESSSREGGEEEKNTRQHASDIVAWPPVWWRDDELTMMDAYLKKKRALINSKKIPPEEKMMLLEQMEVMNKVLSESVLAKKRRENLSTNDSEDEEDKLEEKSKPRENFEKKKKTLQEMIASLSPDGRRDAESIAHDMAFHPPKVWRPNTTKVYESIRGRIDRNLDRWLNRDSAYKVRHNLPPRYSSHNFTPRPSSNTPLPPRTPSSKPPRTLHFDEDDDSPRRKRSHHEKFKKKTSAGTSQRYSPILTRKRAKLYLKQHQPVSGKGVSEIRGRKKTNERRKITAVGKNDFLQYFK